MNTYTHVRRVVCAAIRLPIRKPSGVIITSARHFDNHMRETLQQMNITLKHMDREDIEEGFIDQQGKFMNRQEAWNVARAAHQVIRRCGGDDTNGGTLYSENLY